VIEPVNSLPVGIAASMGDPQTTARPHYRVQSVSHATGRLSALDLPVNTLVLKGLPIRYHNKAVAVELGADKLAEKLARPDLQD
jgi:hypothetical protein